MLGVAKFSCILIAVLFAPAQLGAQGTADFEAQYRRTCTQITPDNAAICAMMRLTVDEMTRKDHSSDDWDEPIDDPHEPRTKTGSVTASSRPPAGAAAPQVGGLVLNPRSRQRVEDEMAGMPIDRNAPASQVFRRLPDGYGNAEQRAYWEANCANKSWQMGSIEQSNCSFLLDRTGARDASSIANMRPDGSPRSEPRPPTINTWRSPDLARSGTGDANPMNPQTRQPCVVLVGSEWKRFNSLGSNSAEAHHVMTFRNTCTGTAVVRADRGGGNESSGGINGGGQSTLTCANYGSGSCPSGHLGWYVHSYSP